MKKKNKKRKVLCTMSENNFFDKKAIKIAPSVLRNYLNNLVDDIKKVFYLTTSFATGITLVPNILVFPTDNEKILGLPHSFWFSLYIIMIMICAFVFIWNLVILVIKHMNNNFFTVDTLIDKLTK